jgi:hypothetical protein
LFAKRVDRCAQGVTIVGWATARQMIVRVLSGVGHMASGIIGDSRLHQLVRIIIGIRCGGWRPFAIRRR